MREVVNVSTGRHPQDFVSQTEGGGPRFAAFIASSPHSRQAIGAILPRVPRGVASIS